ncbi:MAG: hypothetical protein A3F16_03160 [Deltaproteobacteria bacterium RIFCSPHIGHO2_12_FULL_43_9]|nr:MAG: hypothetical protein A3F16_03160 [Deltaproteobacteria bacterium RIFCSPHIGHO2_12_FULL_43_9]
MISYFPTCCLWCESTHDILDDWQICRRCHEDVFVNSFINSVNKIPFYAESFSSRYLFNGSLREMIIKWKYNPSPEYTRPLGMAALTSWGMESINFDYIIPVPPHIERLKERKIHQTLLLAKWIGNWFGVPIFYDIYRTKRTPSQTALTRSERVENLLNSFAVEKSRMLNHKSILLMDDIMTTGATLRNLISVVRRANPRAIHVRTIAYNQIRKSL